MTMAVDENPQTDRFFPVNTPGVSSMARWKPREPWRRPAPSNWKVYKRSALSYLKSSEISEMCFGMDIYGSENGYTLW